ncbi:MAG TPA: SDR family NAD(P)-dependent oxidoreductase [Nocardioidaceae bacterium]|nr:SDR family NAD(P)-dependent oxidoreductase [Nocardioidaceae bacterium]
MKNVAGKKVLITGAAMGMGKMYAQLAVDEGAAAVILWDLNENALKETAEELRAAGGTVHEYVVDVSTREAVADAAARVRSEVGDPEIVINNAGIVRGNKYFWECDPTDSELTLKVNSLAPMLVAREFLPGMIDSGTDCRLVNVASSAGFVANPRMASYASSKWAAIGFSDSVRVELEQAGHDHVKVTTVCPYYVKTGMFDGAKAGLLLPLLEPEDVVNTTWKRMKKGSAFVIMPKTVLLNESIKGLVPTPLRDFLVGKAFGVHKTMEEFKGRPQE